MVASSFKGLTGSKSGGTHQGTSDPTNQTGSSSARKIFHEFDFSEDKVFEMG